uniref:C-type lectin domain-containing protein n=1 Tax=Ditylenchus dipsaci TaxID=166011 RepID=A0A915E4P9_9BILA
MLEEHSHLASVHSYEENEYIASLLNVAPRKNACSFSNVDGSDTFFVPTTFQKGLYPWADRRSNRQGDPEAEPNNDGKKGPENCTEMIALLMVFALAWLEVVLQWSWFGIRATVIIEADCERWSISFELQEAEEKLKRDLRKLLLLSVP